MRREFSRQQGMALVMVLCFLALTTALVMAFISAITREVSATRQDDGQARARQLIEVSTNVVMGQIKQATSRGPGVAWVSQPGMIRTYGNGNNEATPAPLAYYKLYSSNDMEESLAEITDEMTGRSIFDPSADVPADWASHPAQFTDLNAPAMGSDGMSHYPILDPSATSGTGAIPGCRLSGATPASSSNAAPMPVHWIYVLRDGTLTSSVSGSGNSLRWSTTSVAYKTPTRDNPLVGRIAFWTDDETCKVNINTASKGTYWDLPRAATGSYHTETKLYDNEKALALYQPARNEWQRYPGHPATTSLSAVFPDLSDEEIYRIAPCVNRGGSDGGTAIPSGALEADKDRLYASVDELLFNADRSGTNGRLNQEAVERARFCLTANSRAPELTLSGRPRVSCWPFTAAHQSDFDRAIAFCSTIGGKAYYFQRENPNSATQDIQIPRNDELYSYLNTLTSLALPGYGSKFSSKYPANDRTQLLTEIFDYIRCTNLEESQYAPGGWVIPARRGSNTMGFGRAFTLSGLAVGFICNADAAYLPSNTAVNPAIASGTNRLNADQVMVQAVVVPDFFCVAQGWGGIKPDLQVKISGLSKLKLANQTLYDSDSVSLNYTEAPGSVMAGGQSWGGAGGWRYFAAGKITPGESKGVFPLASKSIRFTPASTGTDSPKTMSFTSGTLTVTLGSASTGEVYQTFKIKIPEPKNLPVPSIVREETPKEEDVVEATTEDQWWSFFNYGPPKVSDTGTVYTTGRVANAGLSPGTPGKGNRRAGAFFREDYDVVRGVGLIHGDYRIVAGQQKVDDSQGKLFVPWPGYDDSGRIACQLSSADSGDDLVNSDGSDADRRYFAALEMAPGYRPYIYPKKDASNGPEATGDFDNGLAAAMDGPYINKPDEGDTYGMECTPPQPPYFYDPGKRTSSAVFFSPNRMMPSPGMFGSLPSMLVSGTPWRTLLFRPQGEEFGTGKPLGRHPATTGTAALYVTSSGTAVLPDHLLLDLFWMPVVEPYALSEPFSTAGKVNLNYQIVPFTYIERSTALRAVLKAEMLGAIPNGRAADYKTGADSLDIRRKIDVNGDSAADGEPGTLAQFEYKFARGELFKSASEICDLHIFPEGLESSPAAMARFWKESQLTGDNLRERIYTTLYPRLTTRSNTFTVHYRVQALKQIEAGRSGAAKWAAWDEARDKVLSECRGATVIERYVDPNQGKSTTDPKDDLPDFATDGISKNLDAYYRFRVISSTRFSP